MTEEVFVVKLISSRDCFLHFSGSAFHKFSSRNLLSVVKLIRDNINDDLYFSLAPQPCFALNDNCIGISSILANHLGLADNAIVVVSLCDQVPVVKTLRVSAATQEDYEMIEMSQDELQSSMLDQIRIVSVSQPITVWFSKKLHCTMFVDLLDATSKVGRLEQFTDVIVSPFVKKESSYCDVNSKKHNTDIDCDMFENEAVLNKCKSEACDITCSKLNETIRKEKHSGIFRVILLNNDTISCCDLHNSVKNPYNAFLDKDVFKLWANRDNGDYSAVICYLTLLPKKFTREIYRKNSEFGVYIRLYSKQDSCRCFPFIKYGSSCKTHVLYLSNTVKNILHLRTGSKVRIKLFIPSLDMKITHVEVLFPDNLSKESVKSWFREGLSNSGNVLINNNRPMPVESCTGTLEYVTIRLWPSTIPCWPFSSAELKICKLSITYAGDKDSDERDESENEDDKNSSEDDEDVVSTCKKTFTPLTLMSGTLRDVVNEGLMSCELCLKLSSFSLLQSMPVHMYNNVLCVGSGSYILMEWLCNWLSRLPYNIYITKIDCKSLKGKKVENIQKKFTEKLQKCLYHQPSLLVVLDIDEIAGAPSQLENRSEEIFLTGMGRMIRDTLLDHQLNQSIGVLATALSTSNVNAEMLGPRGYHLFPTLLQIPALSKDDRVFIIKEILKARLKLSNLNNINFEEFATRSDGYSFDDLSLLADKVLFQTWQRKVKDEKNKKLIVTQDDFMCALNSYTPNHLHSINLYKNIDNSWNSVGGMKELKESLTEVIIWPSKFAQVFKQCPLKSESGVLLYGVPGTGKTLLASALAGEAGLNFISIKGPELLSKYIGASEEAVRKVFEKAKKAKPCILFFDEFDSLAPRRGHDSSGVMDRVVNQLLTQMDGVEERTGVYIIAATSRPDLLDPALLRPGRIGHTLHCPLPNANDRVEIMKVLSKRLVLDADCSLSFIADQTDGFSGADLQAVIYGAQMLAYDDFENESNMSVEGSSEDFTVNVKQNVMNKLVVKNSHIIAALKDTNPSLKLEELRRYQRIYESFQRMRSKTSQGESITSEMTQRVTLA